MLNNTTSPESPDTHLSEDNTLAVLAFTQDPNEHSVALKLQAIKDDAGNLANIVELWKSDSPIVDNGFSNDCHWRCSDNFLFVSSTLACSANDDLQLIAKQAYQNILQTIQESNHQHLLRFWNIIPRINVGAGDKENYKRFCNGRLTAFEEFKVREEDYPSASAVGHYADGITVYAISSRLKPGHISNPRQIDASNIPANTVPAAPHLRVLPMCH